MVAATPGVNLDLPPSEWKNHRFGLTADRWEGLGGKSFWITGAGTGYGRSISVALAAAGATVFLSGRRQEKLEETQAEMADLGAKVTAAHSTPVDVTDPDAVAAAAAEIVERVSSLHGLVHAAALPQPAAGEWPLAEMTDKQWTALMATNVMAPWRVTQATLPMMAAGGAARVLFFSSTAGWHFTPGFGAYNVSKAAVNSLGASMAAETQARYPDADIQINVLDPGEAGTEMNQASEISPYAVVPMALLLLSHPKDGPNGKFFHRDGRHLAFGATEPYDRPLS